MTIKFITLSSLMKCKSLSGLTRTEMATRLETSIGQGIFSLFNGALLPDSLQQMYGNKNPGAWLENIIVHSDKLKDFGLEYLIIDTLENLPYQAVNKIGSLLQTISQHGIHIVAIDKDKNPILLNTMREIICTDEFIKIYVKSIREQSSTINHKKEAAAHHAHRAPRKSAGHFQRMEQIFIA